MRVWFRWLRAYAGGMYKRTPEAERLLAQSDSELAESSERSGRKLSWSAAEREHLTMIGDTVSRRAHLQRAVSEHRPDRLQKPMSVVHGDSAM